VAAARDIEGRRRPDEALCASISVPFRDIITPDDLVASVRDPATHARWGAHLARLYGETPVPMVLDFCDRHGITAGELARSYGWCRDRFACVNEAIEAHLESLLPA
jgi:hypothetical protein